MHSALYVLFFFYYYFASRVLHAFIPHANFPNFDTQVRRHRFIATHLWLRTLKKKKKMANQRCHRLATHVKVDLPNYQFILFKVWRTQQVHDKILTEF